MDDTEYKVEFRFTKNEIPRLADTRISGSKWVKPSSSKFRTTGTARTK